jgi:hypothetical protein
LSKKRFTGGFRANAPHIPAFRLIPKRAAQKKIAVRGFNSDDNLKISVNGF